jgi:transcriptional regulator with XRE-family HTH domain
MPEDDAQERQQRRQAAGAWLKTQREARSWSGSDLARRSGVPQTRVSSYERGAYEVSDDAAELLATALEIPLLETRRQLGLWVPAPADLNGYARYVDPTQISDDALLGEVVRRYQQLTDREVVDTYPTRSRVPGDLWDQLIQDARGEILLGGYTNYFFWTERPNFAATLREKAAAGVRVRVLLGDPAGEVTRRREGIEQAQLSLTTRINITLDELAKLGEVPGLEVRFSDRNADAHVSRSIFVFGGEALVCEHIAERLGHGSLTFHLRRKQDGGAFDQYKAHFDHLWSGGREWRPAPASAR